MLTLAATLENDQPLPAWLSFNPSTRTFGGVPSTGDIGIITVKVIASDSGNPALTATTTFKLVVVDSLVPWQNPVIIQDVNGDSLVTPNDVLRVINEINHPTVADAVTLILPNPPGAQVPPPFYDVDGNGFVTPIDVLRVINEINANLSLEGEGNAWSPVLAAWDAPTAVVDDGSGVVSAGRPERHTKPHPVLHNRPRPTNWPSVGKGNRHSLSDQADKRMRGDSGIVSSRDEDLRDSRF